MLFSFLILFQPAPQVIVREPIAASPWTQTFKATCGDQTLEIKRHLRPLKKRADVRLNGRRPSGEIDRLEQQLSEVSAAYRMSLQCEQQGDGLWFRWVRGLRDENSEKVTYQTGAANFKGGKLINVASDENTDEENFWYR